MKLFSWMQKKLHPACSQYSRVPSSKVDLDRTRLAETGIMSKTVLLNDLLDGILTVGTLGHVQPQSSPLLTLSSPSLSVDKHRFSVQDVEEQKQEVEMIHVSLEMKEAKMVIVEPRPPLTSQPIAVVPSVILFNNDKVGGAAQTSNCDIQQPLLKEETEMAEKPRMTLADLFAATATEFSPVISNSGDPPVKNAREKTKAKQRTLFPAKKYSSSDSKVKEPTSASKVNRVITRMLKKKVHPSEKAGTASWFPPEEKAVRKAKCHHINGLLSKEL